MIRRFINDKRLPAWVLALLLSAGLAGCIKERDEEPTDGKVRPVVFSPSVSSRAAAGHPVENGATIPVGDYYFGVYAWVTSTAADPVEPFAELQNAKVQHASANEYTYNPVASWPRDADALLACMAYYPWSDNSGNIKVTTGTGANQTMTINYAVPADAGQHVDLMYAKTGMTAGYDPVNLDFRHALARLKFEGRTEGFPVGSVVKITGIKVTGAVLRGNLIVLDPMTQPGKPWWELSTAPGDKGTITMPAAHLTGLPLTSALESVMTPGGDMLVLPQSVTGLTVEVTASLGGAAFPEPFVFSLTSTPDWTMNEIITYEITLMPDGTHLTAKVSEWTTDPVSVVYDGQWWLEVSEDEYRFDAGGSEFTLTAETNYNRADLGFPAGLQIDAAEIVYSPAVSSGDEWLTLTNVTGANGDLTREIKITAAANTTDAERSAKVYIKAGNLSKVINLTQNNLFIRITDEQGNEITELSFSSFNTTTVIDPQKFHVYWNTGTECIVTENSGGTFQLDAGIASPTGIIDGGVREFTIQPTLTPMPGTGNPYTLSSVLTFTSTDLSGNVVTVNLTLNHTVTTIEVLPPSTLTNTYVGAFWRASQMGERLILMTVPVGTWSAQVIEGADFIRLDMIPSDGSGDAESRPVTNGKTIITGNASSGSGNLFFRMGLTGKLSDDKPDYISQPRFGQVLITYPGGSHILYVRQGEKPVPMLGSTLNWSVYNITDLQNRNTAILGNKGGSFTEYPSQAGYFFKCYDTKAYHPIDAVSWTNKVNGGDVCPEGYHTPTINDLESGIGITGSQFWGCYADGFFDRGSIYTPGGTTPGTNSAVGTGSSVAYFGRLIYNPGTKTSLFIPASGRRNGSSLQNAGAAAGLWSSITDAGNYFVLYYDLSMPRRGSYGSALFETYGYSIRCVKD